MNADRLLAHYKRIADAPDAISRLRRFILDLAVRGKLVPQDANDEPASELLKRIAKEKARLVKAGEMKKEKPLPTVDEDADFDVPPTWLWTRLGIVTSYIQRGKSPKYATADGSLVVSQKCVQWRGLDLSVAKQITVESLADYEDIRFLRDGDLLWNSTGTGTIGRIIRLVDPPEKLVCDSHVTVVRSLEVEPEYIRAWLRSDHVYALIEDRAAGSTNQVELTAQMAINQVIPLPPLAEQYRIVAKVDELMGLCDRLEAARAGREAVRDRLAAASLARLNAPDPETFQDDAYFALDALPALTTRPDQIKRLRQSILNLAVRGKLVPQDPNDEPASELLKRIAEEKARLRLRAVPLPTSAWPLPTGWAEATMGSYATDVFTGPFGSMLHQSDYVHGGVPLINPSHMKDDRIVHDPKVSVDAVMASRMSSYTLAAGDIVMARRGEVGRAALVEPAQSGWLCGTGSFFLRFLDEVDRRFLLLVLQTSELRAYLVGKAVGTTMVNLNHGILKNAPLLVPPLAEQHRIVAKVDALMALCDRLEASLTTAAAIRRRLLDALLAEALERVGQEQTETAE